MNDQPVIDLEYAHFERVVGEYRVVGTWFRQPDGQQEPCLFIVPSDGRIDFGCRPAIVLLSSAYLYVNPRDAAHTVAGLAKGMGKDSMQSAIRLMDLINDSITDLMGIPPDRRPREVMGDAEVKIGDGPRRSIQLLQ